VTVHRTSCRGTIVRRESNCQYQYDQGSGDKDSIRACHDKKVRLPRASGQQIPTIASTAGVWRSIVAAPSRLFVTRGVSPVRAPPAPAGRPPERLMDLYLDKALTLDEYRMRKNQLISGREVLTSSLSAFEHNRSVSFEPALRFIKAAQAAIVATDGNTTEQRDFPRKAASNSRLRDGAFTYEFQKPWHLVADQRFPDEHEKPAPASGAKLPTEIDVLAKHNRRARSGFPFSLQFTFAHARSWCFIAPRGRLFTELSQELPPV
jgi:hypothetical protein